MSLASSRFESERSFERIYHQFERSPYAEISSTALTYEASPRIYSLAKPKARRDTTIRDGFCRYYSDPNYSGVSKAAARACCSARLTDLARPLKRHQYYQYERPSIRPVSHEALRYQVTPRVTELATPKRPSTGR